MSRRTIRSRIALVVLSLVLVAPWASASQPQSRRTERSPGVMSSSLPWRLMEILRGLFPSSWAKNGCSADPDGRPVCQQVPSTPTTTSENGCSLDPDGRCRTGS